jgi:glycosyltransferase involved in cell wall biosynthesis
VIPQISEIIRRRDPHIVQSHQVKSHFLVSLCNERRRRKWLAFHHGYTATDSKTRLYNQLNRWSLRRADHVVTVCGAFSRRLQQRERVERNRISVLHNTVNTDAFNILDAPSRPVNVVDVNGPVVMVVGRLSREKGQLDFLEAFRTVLENVAAPAPSALLFGDGPDRDLLQERATTLGIAEQVRFMGHIHDLLPYYASADLLVLPSHSEGSPNALLEAMAAGVAVVATAVGGVPEIATDETNALVVPSRDPERLAGAMLRLLHSDELRRQLASAARCHVAQHHSPESYAAKMSEIYRNLVSINGMETH